MNIILIIATAFVFAANAVTADEYHSKISEEQKKRILEYVAVCAEENSIDEASVQTLRAGQFANADQRVQCFTNCFVEKAGFLVDGQVQNDVILAKLGSIFGSDKVKAAMAQCNSVKGADNCATAFELYKCYFNSKAAAIMY